MGTDPTMQCGSSEPLPPLWNLPVSNKLGPEHSQSKRPSFSVTKTPECALALVSARLGGLGRVTTRFVGLGTKFVEGFACGSPWEVKGFLVKALLRAHW